MPKAFRIPDHEFHEDHLGDGSQAPVGCIKLRLRCRPDFCKGVMTVEVVEADTSAVLTASGDVRCTGKYVEHTLDLTVTRPLQETESYPRFRCGNEQENGDKTRIWIRSG